MIKIFDNTTGYINLLRLDPRTFSKEMNVCITITRDAKRFFHLSFRLKRFEEKEPS